MMIDAEGSEPFVLRGAEKLINRCHPILVIEINKFALDRYGFTSKDIFNWLSEHGYGWEAIQPGLVADPPQYDVIARHVPPKPTVMDQLLAPNKAWNGEQVEKLVLELASYCTNPIGTSRVRKALVGAKILPDRVLFWLKQKKHH
jgi:hypothetical protein